jgi:putative transposase
VPFYPSPRAAPTFADLLHSFGLADSDPTFPLLEDSDIRHACDQLGVHFGEGTAEVWNPVLTLWAFLVQVASSAKSCTAAVARALCWRLALGLDACSANSGAYCKARQKLPEALLRHLSVGVAARLEQQAPRPWRWRGRRVRVIDGTVVTAADTPANQEVYPQRDHLPAAAGFPLVRLVVLFSLATAACIDCVFGPYRGKGSGETTLARSLLDDLAPGDVLLGDRLFGTYWMFAWLLGRRADGVFRLHAHRRRDGSSRSSRTQRQLGEQDNLIVWQRPKRPAWMDEGTYAAIQRQVVVRILWRRVEVPGFRTREVTLATTLLDASVDSAEGLVGLYRQRWLAEIFQADCRSSGSLYLGGVAA